MEGGEEDEVETATDKEEDVLGGGIVEGGETFEEGKGFREQASFAVRLGVSEFEEESSGVEHEASAQGASTGEAEELAGDDVVFVLVGKEGVDVGVFDEGELGELLGCPLVKHSGADTGVGCAGHGDLEV
jgi:hypothetical protein